MDKLRTSGIKLSEIRPCDNCGGKIAPIFLVVEIKTAVFNERNVNAVLGVNQIFGGRALRLAEVMAPGADDAVEVLENEESVTKLFICQRCYAGDLCLLEIGAKIQESRAMEHESRDTSA